MKVYNFSKWRTAAILDLEAKIISNLVPTYCNEFVMQELVGFHILFVLLAHLLPEIHSFSNRRSRFPKEISADPSSGRHPVPTCDR